MQGKLEYLVGDATKPRIKRTIVAQGNNTIGAWGSGFVLAIDKLSPNPKNEYRKWYNETTFYSKDDSCVVSKDGELDHPFMLGEIQLVEARKDLYVANMLTQKGCGQDRFGMIPFRYEAALECFRRLSLAAKCLKISTITAPKIGAGLAMANWLEIEKLITLAILSQGINVDIYVPKS